MENSINSIKNSTLENLIKIYADSEYLKSVLIPYEISQYENYYDALVFEAINRIWKNKDYILQS